MFLNQESSGRILRVKGIDTNSFVPFPLNYTESSYPDEISERILPGNSDVPALGGCFRARAGVLNAQTAYNWNDSLNFSASASQVTK